VRRVDEAVRPFIAPEAQYFLRANLALQLQAARLAMLRGEEAIFEQSLDDAANWLTEYYDTDKMPVQSALRTIADIRDSELSVALPDISESLRLLRQFNALADANSRISSESTDEIAAEPEQ
jgi:uroporphyrin-3 C-methyltransferase